MFDLPKYGDGLPLARVAALLTQLGIDRDRLQPRCIVITGSNGKGSTSAFCARIGEAYDLRVGLFTSPHLLRFNERFQINGEMISNETFAALQARVVTAINTLTTAHPDWRFGAFEAQFALACLHVSEADCDLFVCEAGVGGRFDVSRLLGARVTAVTSIDLEHTALLGATLELIATDKSDACASGGVIVYGDNCRPFRQQLDEYNRPRHVTGIFIGDEITISNATHADARQSFDYHVEARSYRALETSLLGSFQINNAAIAASLFALWLKGSGHTIDESKLEQAVREGLGATVWPGRLECIQQAPLTVIDVGHTPDGVQQSLSSLATIYPDHQWILVTGVSADKNLDHIIAHLAPSFCTIICTAAYHKGAAANDVALAVRKANSLASVHIADTIERAVELSQSLALAASASIYVAGGLFVSIEYAEALRGNDPCALRFF